MRQRGDHRGAQAGRPLLHHESLRHSYPHCWRHKTPVIFRATPQWFISMERAGLRAHTLRELRCAVDARVGRAAYHRHDREPPRLVHLPATHLGGADSAVRAQTDGERHPRTEELIERPRLGSRRRDRRLVRARAAGAARRGRRALRQGHRRHGRVGRLGAVVRVRRRRAPEVTAGGAVPRGLGSASWLVHSSLLMSEALYERAPYRGVLTHGFTVDEKGRKMSKSSVTSWRRRRS